MKDGIPLAYAQVPGALCHGVRVHTDIYGENRKKFSLGPSPRPQLEGSSKRPSSIALGERLSRVVRAPRTA
jgi:hypothetical protein